LDLSVLIDRCIAIMQDKNMTNKDLAQLAQISESTVSRVLASKGSNASAATITAICDALGVGAEAAQYAGGVCERTKDELYEARIDDLQRAIARKERWNKRLFVVCVCLTAFILLLFAVDILNPNIGWFRT
jgi:DNA-binding helix-turn-helix protein